MAFSSSNLDLEVVFDLTNSPKDFSITDNTDYSAETYSNVLGLLKAVAPSGTQFYNNTSYASPDIDYGSSISSSALASLPLISSEVETGSYIFTYTIKIEDMLQSHTIVSNNSAGKTFTIAGNYVSQILDGTAADWNCVDAVTTALTIVSATYSSSSGLTTVTIDETLGSLTAQAQFQWTVDVTYSKVFTQAYTYESPDVCLNWVNDECCSSMTITDVTAYASGATVTRLHTVSYPVGISPAKDDIESSLQELTITPIWTGTWTDIFTADIETSVGIISVVDAVSGVKEHKVSSDEGLCQIYACITAMATKYTSYLTSQPQKALEMAKYINQASAAYMAYTIGKKCGKTDYEQYLTIITEIADSCGCGCDCADCADGTPTQVVGCCENVGGSDFTIVLDSPNGSITISTSTIGTTTTFEIDVDGTWLTTQITNGIAAASIGDLIDVNDANIAAVTGQVLSWNSGTGKWERALPQTALVNLTDVDDTGLADQMVLYYDGGAGDFKFQLVVKTLATLTDVNLVSLADGDILKYDSGTSKWLNVDNFLSLLSDVNVSGLADGNGLKWDSGTSKWIVFAPKLTLESLDDTDIDDTTPLNDLDRLQYNVSGGNKWENVPLPTFSSSGVTFPSGYSASYGGSEQDFGYAYDQLTDELTIRGTISNSNGAVTPGPVLIATLPNTIWPQATVPFICTVGIGATNAIAIGNINPSNGEINIYFYMDPDVTPTGMISGIPAGGISFSAIIKYYTTI